MSADETLARIDEAVDDWSVTRDYRTSPDAMRAAPEPLPDVVPTAYPAYAGAPRHHAMTLPQPGPRPSLLQRVGIWAINLVADRVAAVLDRCVR